MTRSCGRDTRTGRVRSISSCVRPRLEPAAGDQPWQAYCDAAGSLLPQHTLPRSAAGQRPQPIGQEAATSLLPLADQTYQDAAATTADDLATLAPQVPATVRPAVEAADPTLDADVAAWLDPGTDQPR